MKNKILVNSAMVTEDWKKYVGGAARVLVSAVVGMALMIPAALLWFVSLGHINFVQLIDSWMEKNITSDQITL